MIDKSLVEAVASVPVTEARRDLVESVITAWRAQRAQRLEENRIMEASKKIELQLSSWLLEVFKQQKLEGMLIGGRVTGLAEKEVAVVADKKEFMDYILKEGALELLQFRISTSAVDERRDNGVEVPGVRYDKVHDLFDRKS